MDALNSYWRYVISALDAETRGLEARGAALSQAPPAERVEEWLRVHADPLCEEVERIRPDQAGMDLTELHRAAAELRVKPG